MGRKPKQRFSFPTAAPSGPLDAVSKNAEEALKNAEKNAEEKKEIKKADNSVPQIFTADQVAFVFDVYVALLCLIYSFLFKCKFESLWEELSFDEREKLDLAKPLAHIASKYAPSTWAGMTAEIELITRMGIWSVASLKRASNVAATERRKKEEEEQRRRAEARPIDARSQARSVAVPL